MNWISGIVESQGLVAVMLAWMIIQNSRERAALLHKNCELSAFIMKCLDRELGEDHPSARMPQDSPKSSNLDDLQSVDIGIPFR